MTKQEARQRTAEIGIVPVVRTSSSQKVLLAPDALKQAGNRSRRGDPTVPGAEQPQVYLGVISDLTKQSP